MSEINDGGPAFPRIEPASGGDGPRIYFVMTLRDYFAAKALPWCIGQCDPENWAKNSAKAAYDVADAMLEARK